MHIEKDGKIFTPRYGESGEIIATAEQVYQEWVNQQNSPPTQTTKERLAEVENAIASIVGGAI